ncbi:molecular chaperone MKKS-like isoform X1 [Panulirus ornatus]|uniref:molecular chaperone MKKS-like isoform X1 n=1 Tax=Panulirus ornatus TaxID=150431 RepID=UPI003A885FA6
MTGVQLEEEHVRGLFCHSMQDPAYISMLCQYRRLLFSMYGPKGSSVLISNAAGREILIASSSEVIKQLSFNHPSVKYINALISAQHATCGLNGLYTGALCVRLLEEALRCEEDVPHPVLSDISEWIISELLDLLSKYPAEVTLDLDIGDMEQVTSFVKTILRAKNCLNLSTPAVHDLSLNIVRAFLKSVPNEYSSNGFGHVYIATQEGSSCTEGMVFDGVLHREPDICPQRIEKMGVHNIFSILLFSVPILCVEGRNISMHWRGRGTVEENFINKVLPSLLSCMKRRNIHILASQKPIHPVIKFELERKGYLVLERMGTSTTEAVMKVSGCQAVSDLCNLSVELDNVLLGKLTTVQHIVYNQKTYILLDYTESCVSTLLLPVASPSILSTLKEITESCLAALRMVVVDGKVVAGGGCLEAWIATRIIFLLNTNKQHLIDVMDASPYHINKVGNIFIRVFMELALQLCGGSSTTRFDWCVDSVFHHMWHTQARVIREDRGMGTNILSPCVIPQQCLCGLVKEDDLKYKYNGGWHPVEFQHHDHTVQQSRLNKWVGQSRADTCPRVPDSHSIKSDIEGRSSCDSLVSDFGSHNLDLEADSLEESRETTVDEVDSLEKTVNSQEEEIDSLEGKLESLDAEDVDSLDDMLERVAEPSKFKDKPFKGKLEARAEGALYDSFPAKYNAVRLSLEGFTHLFHIGQCVFDK